MTNYKFEFNDKVYELGEDNFDYLANDEEKPVENFGKSEVLELLNQCREVVFDREFYDLPCENCLAGKAEKAKFFNFLEYHFFIFTKDGKYVISNISDEYENTNFTQLSKMGKVDNSYYVSVAVCENCGHYSIEIEQCEV